MKKSFKFYAIIWAIGLFVFNIATFLVPNIAKFSLNFWFCYAFITIAFVLQLVVAYFSFKEENLKKVFLNVPTFIISFLALIGTVIISSVAMALPAVPGWVGVLVCIVALAVSAVAVLCSKAVANAVSDIDDKVKAQTFFVKALTVDAETLITKAQTPEIKAEVTRVYEAIRYSDPVSNPVISNIESQISMKYNQLSLAVEKNDVDAVKTFTDEVLILVKDRNDKCKLLK